MAARLEHILSKLLTPDNNLIHEATRELREVFNSPKIFLALCDTICVSQNPQVRQYAAILLRRKVIKRRQWAQLSENLRQNVKQMVIQRLLVDEEKMSRNAVGQLAGTIAKHEFPKGNWPEILQFIQEYVKSPHPNARELAMFTLHAIASSASDQLRPHLNALFTLFATTLYETENRMVTIYTVRTMTNLMYLVGTDEKPAVQKLIPRIVILLKELLAEDESYACELLEFFDELVESEVTIIVPHVKAVVETCLEIACNQQLQSNTQAKAMNFICWLTRLKKKTILRHKLEVPILNSLFPIMCQPIDEDDEHNNMQMLSAEENNAGSCAAQVLDTMALNLPPERLIPPLLELIDPALQSDNPYIKKAAYVAIAVTSEGCADYIRTKYLHPFLQSVCKGITDPNHIVRNAALFTLGQFSEYLQPEISKYASELLPLLLEYLLQICQYLQQDAKQEPIGVSRMFYAIEMLCENLGDGLLPYLPTLMERLIIVLTVSKCVGVQELAISTIAATANACKEELLPYFQQIINHLRVYLTDNQPEENLPLQIQSIEILGVFARTIGIKNFLPLAEECMKLGLGLLKTTTDPDLTRSIFGLFAAVSFVLKEDMSSYLPEVIHHMIDCLQSTDGVVTHYKPEGNELNVFDLEDGVVSDDDDEEEDLDDDFDDDEEEDDDVSGYTVENAYMNEKEDACHALQEIAEHTQEGFMPFIQQCTEEVFNFIQYPSASIRKTAIQTLGRFCCTLHTVSEKKDSNEGREAVQKFLETFIPKLGAVITDEVDREAVIGSLETSAELMKILKGTLFLKPDNLELIINAAYDVMRGSVACQDNSDNDELANEGGEAEYDLWLIECAGDVISTLAVALPQEVYQPHFEQFLAHISPKLRETKPISDRSFAAGILAQSCENMQEGVKPFVPKLLPLFLNAVRDEHEEVRSNAIFGLGVLAEHGKEVLFDQYPVILQALSAGLARETCRRPTDNICGAVARLIMTNVNGVPMDQVFPVMIKCLPLKEDIEENDTVFKCFLYLLSARHPQMPRHFPEIVKVCSYVFVNKQINETTRNIIIQILHIIQNDYPKEYQMVAASLSADIVEVLRIAAM